jgi:hypothetical protein
MNGGYVPIGVEGIQKRPDIMLVVNISLGSLL